MSENRRGLAHSRPARLGAGRRPTRTTVATLLFAASFAGYALLVWHAFATTGPQTDPGREADTVAYVRMAALPALHTDFLRGERAFVYPLFLKAAGRDLAVSGYLQTLLSILCWSFLACAALRFVKSISGKVLMCVMVLLCAVREEVLVWNGMALSESLSLSLFALWVGSWIMFVSGRGRFWRHFPLVTSFFFAFVRDSNSYLVLGAALLLALAGAVPRARRGHLLLALGLIALFLGSVASRSHSFRSRYSFANILGGRILVDAWRTSELERRGMPRGLSAGDRGSLAGRCGNEFGGTLGMLTAFKRPGAEDFERWKRTNGLRDYLLFLFEHPGYLLLQPLREEGFLAFVFPLATWVEDHGCNPALRTAVPRVFGTLLPGSVRRTLRGEHPGAFLILWGLAASACVAVCAGRRRPRGPCLFAAALLLASVPHLLVVWHGDALDVPRHAVLVGIQVHLAAALALGICGDSLALGWQRRRARTSS